MRTIKHLAKEIVKQNPAASTLDLARELYNSTLSSPELRECKKIIAKIKRELK